MMLTLNIGFCSARCVCMPHPVNSKAVTALAVYAIYVVTHISNEAFMLAPLVTRDHWLIASSDAAMHQVPVAYLGL